MTEVFEQVSAVSENFIQCQLQKNESLLLLKKHITGIYSPRFVVKTNIIYLK
jgi:hypothetical protein